MQIADNSVAPANPEEDQVQGQSLSLAARLWTRIKVGKHNECWPFEGATIKGGYGVIRGERGSNKVLKAHRVAYADTFGPIPEDDLVLHHCDNPPCCNPWHLFLGDSAANTDDMDRKGRGHLFGRQVVTAKLTLPQVIEIKRRLREGEGPKAIAATFNVVPSTITHISKGRSWKDVP